MLVICLFAKVIKNRNTAIQTIAEYAIMSSAHDVYA